MKGKRLFTAEEEVEDTERAALLSGRGDLSRLPAATLCLLSLSNICRRAPRLPEYLVVSPGSMDGQIYCLCMKKDGGKDATVHEFTCKMCRRGPTIRWLLIPSPKTFSFTSLHLAAEAWSVNKLKCGCGYMLMHKLMWTLTPNRSALGQSCMLTLTGEMFRVCVQVRARVQLGSVLFLWSQTHNPSFTQRNAVSPRRGRPELDLKGEGQRDRDRVLGTGKHSTDPERLQTQADLRFLYIQQKHHLYNMSRDVKCVCELL